MAAKKTFGQTIRELRKAKTPPLTQRDLAERVAARLREGDRRGFDFTYLSKIENDRLPPPSAVAIIALAEELCMDKEGKGIWWLKEKEENQAGKDCSRSWGKGTDQRQQIRLTNVGSEYWAEACRCWATSSDVHKAPPFR